MTIRFAFGPFWSFISLARATGVASNVLFFFMCQVAAIRQPDNTHRIYQPPLCRQIVGTAS
jgi:hypothetical protein